VEGMKSLDISGRVPYNIPMADTLTPEHRSWNMSRIRSKNTQPELAVRSILHRMGFRFRLKGKDEKLM